MVTTDPLIVNSQNTDHTLQIGEWLGQLLGPHHLICLDGDLGAGKTTLVRGIARGWGTPDRVTSPTFMVMNRYQRPNDRQHLYHIDAYRLETATAIESIGLDDILAATGPVLIEWPTLVQAVLPLDYMWVQLETLDEDDRRLLQFEGFGTLHHELLQRLSERITGR